ncbi:MAG: AAA family ATPase [Bacteroidales bacterium]|nr:AAA family ATPase [Bacteroidales bacterium]
MIIIGITGTIGAGKGTIVDYLVKNKKFGHFSVRNFLIEEIKKRKLPVDRDSMTLVANDLRSKHSPSYIIEELYKEAKKTSENCIIESIRAIGEVTALKSKENFYLIAIDANPDLRYKRITNRKSETDNITFETFLANEKREMQNSDPSMQNISKCVEMADFVLTNNGTIEELENKTEKIISKILK